MTAAEPLPPGTTVIYEGTYRYHQGDTLTVLGPCDCPRCPCAEPDCMPHGQPHYRLADDHGEVLGHARHSNLRRALLADQPTTAPHPHVTDHTHTGPATACDTERWGETCGRPAGEHQMRDDEPGDQQPVIAKPAPCSQPNPCEDGELCDRHEVEQAHAAGEHAFCGVTCEVRFPSEPMRNLIIAKGYPGTAGMLDELLRRAARPGDVR